jgi:hypothetical protein
MKEKYFKNTFLLLIQPFWQLTSKVFSKRETIGKQTAMSVRPGTIPQRNKFSRDTKQ